MRERRSEGCRQQARCPAPSSTAVRSPRAPVHPLTRDGQRQPEQRGAQRHIDRQVATVRGCGVAGRRRWAGAGAGLLQDPLSALPAITNPGDTSGGRSPPTAPRTPRTRLENHGLVAVVVFLAAHRTLLLLRLTLLALRLLLLALACRGRRWGGVAQRVAQHAGGLRGPARTRRRRPGAVGAPYGVSPLAFFSAASRASKSGSSSSAAAAGPAHQHKWVFARRRGLLQAAAARGSGGGGTTTASALPLSRCPPAAHTTTTRRAARRVVKGCGRRAAATVWPRRAAALVRRALATAPHWGAASANIGWRGWWEVGSGGRSLQGCVPARVGRRWVQAGRSIAARSALGAAIGHCHPPPAAHPAAGRSRRRRRALVRHDAPCLYCKDRRERMACMPTENSKPRKGGGKGKTAAMVCTSRERRGKREEQRWGARSKTVIYRQRRRTPHTHTGGGAAGAPTPGRSARR